MKKVVFLLCVSLCITALGNAANNSHLGTETFRLNPPDDLNTTVPSDVLQRFYDTFVYDEVGKFRGAYTGEIENYATMPEIIAIVTGTGVETAGVVIYEGYKPRIRGCKQNDKWICTVEGDVVDL